MHFVVRTPRRAVASGGAQNTLVITATDSGLVLQNLGDGDVITTANGDILSLVPNGTVNGVAIYKLEGTTSNNVFSTNVVLARGTNYHSFTNSGANFSYGGGVTASFYAGTLLATENGVIAVEDIAAGTRLKTASGEILPVRWLGYSPVSTRFAEPLRMLPIRIKAGALGENLPERDLMVSPDHAKFIGGVLVQAGAMVNGVSIIRERNVPEIFNYYHVELATHELLLAEGAPTESFIGNVDRFNFANWAEHKALGETAPIVEMDYPRSKSFRRVPMEVRQLLNCPDGRFRAAHRRLRHIELSLI